MSDSSALSSESLRSDLPRKVLVLFLLVLTTAFGLAMLYRQKPGNPILLFNLLADLSLGLVAGLGARNLLRPRNGLIRFLAATAALIVGLFILGLATQWRLGFGPLQFWRKTIDWTGLAQISVGMGMLLLALAAWPSSVTVSVGPAIGMVPSLGITPFVTVVPATSPKALPRHKTPSRSRGPGLASRHRSTRPRPEIKSGRAATRSTRASKAIATAPRTQLFHRKPKVSLSKIERHICPFCFDPVTRNDPRGVVECEICHTLHHADCWEVAGACQVPHYTA